MSATPRSIPFWSPAEIERSIAGTIEHLNARQVLAYPTETVYGFGSGIDADSVKELIAMKGRPAGKPFLLLIAQSEMLGRLDLHLTQSASLLAARFWPGPLTLVLPGGHRRVPNELRGPEGGIAVRWTPHAALTRLILAYGEAITSTSANRPGSPAAMTAGEILEQWPAVVARGTLRVLDGGKLSPSSPSTVVDCTGKTARVIRPGAIPIAALRESVPDTIGDA